MQCSRPDNAFHFDRTHFDVVAVAASAGGLKALSTLLNDLPADFPAAVVVVQHLDPHYRSMLAHILSSRTAMRVVEAREGAVLEPATAYIAPPNHHLLVTVEGTISLSSTEVVHFVRPSADILFESVARCYGPRAVAVVLTGTGVDGATGVKAVKEKGGTVLAQDEETSDFYGMPGSAVQTGGVDRIIPLDGIADVLINLVKTGSLE